MTLQQVKDRMDVVCKRSWLVQGKYGIGNEKARMLLIRMSIEYAMLQSQYLILTTPQPKYPEETL